MMVIRPRVKGFICTTSHPQGVKENVETQINQAKLYKAVNHRDKIKKVLVIGGSTGYGLASRIACSFLLKASTLNVCLERPASEKRTASPGWYNTAAFENKANSNGLYAKTVIGDCFSEDTKQKTIVAIKNDLQKIDLVIYSIASPKRNDYNTGKLYSSVLKPIGKSVVSKSLNINNGQLTKVKIDPASDEEVLSTIKVMGGEDWKNWIELLENEQVLLDNYTTFAYSYIGPDVTHTIYRSGTIGKAKEDLEKTASLIASQSKINGQAFIVVNKALVTHASSAIPILPLYVSALYKVMKEKNLHEDCLDQLLRLFGEKLDYQADRVAPNVDKNGMIRLDDWEMREDVQNSVKKIWNEINQENALKLIDYEGYRSDFLKLFGFGINSVDYEKEINENIKIKDLVS